MRPAERLSLNQITTDRWSLAEAVDGCARSGIGAIGLWREKVAEAGGVRAAARLVRDAGLQVSSLCRGGFFPAADAAGRAAAIDDNRRAIDAAAALGTGYAGPIEVEVLSERVWDTPGDDLLARLVAELDGVLGGGRELATPSG